MLHEDTDVILEQYGVLKVSEEQFATLDQEYLLKTQKTSYGYACFTNHKDFYQENCPGIVMENGSIDELILIMTKSRFIVIGVSVLAGVMIYFLADKCGLLSGESTLILSVLGLVGDAAVDVIGLFVAGCLAVVSYLCSCRIMKKKEL